MRVGSELIYASNSHSALSNEPTSHGRVSVIHRTSSVDAPGGDCFRISWKTQHSSMENTQQTHESSSTKADANSSSTITAIEAPKRNLAVRICDIPM